MLKCLTEAISIAFALVFSAAVASASTVVVDGRSGPWDPLVPGNTYYGGINGSSQAIDAGLTFPNNAPPSSLAVIAGQSYLISYLSGLTDSFCACAPVVDAAGYPDLTGPGFFGSFPMDSANLNALIGAFVDGSGLVLSFFAPGNGPYTVTAPAGAVALLLGVNDDNFIDNSGSLSISVTAVPEVSTWAMMILGMCVIGVVGWRRNQSGTQNRIA